MQLFRDGNRDHHVVMKGGQNFDLSDENQVIQRGGVGNDGHLHAPATVRLAVRVQVFRRVVKINSGVLKKSSDFIGAGA